MRFARLPFVLLFSIAAVAVNGGYFCGPAVQNRILQSLYYDYNPDVRPNSGISPTLVRVNMGIVNIQWVDETKHEFRSTVYVRFKWNDARLRWSNYYYCENLDYLTLVRPEAVEEPWKPIPAYMDRVEGFDSPGVVRLYPNGDVSYTVESTQTVFCPALAKADDNGEFVCTLNVHPFEYDSDDVILKWDQSSEYDPITIVNKVPLVVTGYDVKSFLPKSDFVKGLYGEVSVVGMEVHFASQTE